METTGRSITQAKEVSAKEDATKEEINEAISNLEKIYECS